MCRDILGGGRRCPTSHRSSSLNSARKRMRRAESALSIEELTPERREKLTQRLHKALEEYNEARLPTDEEGHYIATSESTPDVPLAAVLLSFPEMTQRGDTGTDRLVQRMFSGFEALNYEIDIEDTEFDAEECEEFIEYNSGMDVTDFVVEKLLEYTRMTEGGVSESIEPFAKFAKKEVTEKLTEKMSHVSNADLGVSEDEDRAEAVSNLISEWALGYSRSDSGGIIDGGASRLQDAGERFLNNNMRPVTDSTTPQGRAYDAFIAAQYAETQDYLQKANITEVGVYRGFGWMVDTGTFNQEYVAPPAWAVTPSYDGGARDVALSSLSSFSTSEEIATTFASKNDSSRLGTLISGTVPASRILSTPRTGIGCLGEQELVILGGTGQWNVTGCSGEWEDFDEIAEEYGWNYEKETA